MKNAIIVEAGTEKKQAQCGQMPLLNDAGFPLPGGLHARQALLDYLQMGPGRKLESLLSRYQSLETAPTRRRSTLLSWSERFDWQTRAAEYDADQAAAVEQEKRQRVQIALEDGLALSSERVMRLKKLYLRLEGWLESSWQGLPVFEENAFSSKEGAQLLRFIDRLLVHMRGILDDLAAETGGRSRLPVSLSDERSAG